MKTKNTLFYKQNQTYLLNFSAEEVSSDTSMFLAEKIERKHHLIKDISKSIIDKRDPVLIKHTYEDILKQRVFLMMQGYEDANDANHLKNDPVMKSIFKKDLASQPTVSRFENVIDKQTIFKVLYGWLERYVKSLEGRDKVIIDIDATDDPTYGAQQLSLYNGYYGQFMYNELLFHDGETGQIILPVLRPGNSHSNKWYVSILKRIVRAIKSQYPNITIIVRADSGFSNAPFYKLADDESLFYAIGLATNEVLKRRVQRVVTAVKHLYLSKKEKYQHFISFQYQAGSWHSPQQCYSKIESTGIGMNVRHFVSNMPEMDAREIYFGFYVKRGDASENRIKELKNMCFSDRLSNHSFWANFMRLIISSLVYEMFLIIKKMIKKTRFTRAHKWQIDNIRLYLLKAGGTIKKTAKRIYFKISKAFVYKDLLIELAFQ
ncbi:MAG: IS1380 family transposase [Chlorobi bacterium]|nr:IS1380 family transposase [Chlorobiota bacterium]